MMLKFKNSINPMMNFVDVANYESYLKNKISNLNNDQNILDIGGRRGKNFKTGTANYCVLELAKHNDEMFIQGDITSDRLEINKKTQNDFDYFNYSRVNYE